MSDFDKLNDRRAMPEDLPRSGARMRDVAEAAGVSVATVSNVVNHPDLVAFRTRERVQIVIREMDFHPDPHAKALRGLVPSNAKPGPRRGPESIRSGRQKVMETQLNPVTDSCFAPANSGLDLEILMPGNQLTLRVGPELLSGTVDEVMPDKSCFWIWTDGGMGRRMIDSSEAAAADAKTGT
ncbi:LacI family DNA-binding transcriptional regulator [Arthrobacter sp. P2b]|uniref:LacI family DNA-binding transcriptional regulator n=1 Tax=Arthrobacter sp. P2b TaxID=1938741 RepID=UPI0015E46D97|nr:LacI family DNA-binding transcriptional regulator [Arthrobacter sp. P2b]